jgi:ubiquinone/menaquinone biosynthesis C-methylase UbiE
MTGYDLVMADGFGFMKSRVIITAADLDLFTVLDGASTSAKTVANAMNLDPRATTRLLDCLVSLDLLFKTDSNYRLAPQGAYLSSNHPETILPVILHLSRLWDGWSRLTDTVRKGSTGTHPPVMDEGTRGAFIGAMDVIGRTLSLEIADAYDLSRFSCLLDIGGASGTYTIAFLKKNPNMKAVIFDLENVIPMARKRVTSENLCERVEFAAGDFYQDELPGGSDLALLSAIIHQNSPEENVELFSKTYRALEPGGTILIRDHIMDESRTRPPAGTLFALNMLINTRGGDTYTIEEVKSFLEQAGFFDVRLARMGQNMDCLVEARKPE